MTLAGQLDGNEPDPCIPVIPTDGTVTLRHADGSETELAISGSCSSSVAADGSYTVHLSRLLDRSTPDGAAEASDLTAVIIDGKVFPLR
jgi:hypothetical protein